MLVAGLSAHRPFDDGYRSFVGLVAQQINAGLVEARARQLEHERMERLAELDRAKTAFFANVYTSARTTAEPTAPAESRTGHPFAGALARDAARWLADAGGARETPTDVTDDLLGPPGASGQARQGTILVADDNADMRAYLQRLLSPRWEVALAADGAAALEAALRLRPDLLLADVMMPGLDGFELLTRVRAQPALAQLPVVLLTARAGAEAAIQGLLAGADDYIAKPFSPRELLARIQAAVERARAEAALRASEERLRHVLDGMGEGFGLLAPDFTILEHNREALRMDGRAREEIVGRSHWDAFPETERSELGQLLKRAMAERVPVSLEHHYAWEAERALWLEMRAYPTADGSLAVFWRDVTERHEAQDALRQSEAKYRTLFETMDEGFAIMELVRDGQGQVVDLIYREVNQALERQTGLRDVLGKSVLETMPTYDPSRLQQYQHISDTGESSRTEYGVPDLRRWFRSTHMRVGGAGSPLVASVFEDITERKRQEQRQRFLLTLSDALRPLADADDIQETSARVLGEHLGATRAFYFTAERDEHSGGYVHVIRRDYCRHPDMPSLVGRHPQPAAGENGYALLAHGEKLVVQDVNQHAGVTSEYLASYRARGIRSFIAVPLMKGGRYVAAFGVNDAAPRDWTADEIALVEETTERTWAAVERARVEEALRESEERLRALVENLPGGAAFIVDRELRYRLAAGEALHAAGVDPQEYLGKTIFEALPPDLVASYAPHYRQALAGEAFLHEHAAHGRAYISRGTPLHTARGEVYAVLAVSYDISDRKHAEAALRASEERFRTVTDAVPQLIWANDATGQATYFNRRWYAYSGLSEEQSLGPGWQAIVHPDDAPASVERWRQALVAGEVFESEYRLRRADGVYRWHLGRNVPLRDEDGTIIGWFGTATDIEALKLAEAARQESAILRRLAAAQEEERLRIARDLHDQLGQLITGLLLRVKHLEEPARGTAVAPLLPPVQALAIDMAKEAHRIAVNLRPTALEDVGLVPALERLVADWGRQTTVPAAFASSGLEQGRFPRPVEVALFRVVQEALTNVQKHADATQVSVIIEPRGNQIVLIVEDDGRGFAADAALGDPGQQRLGLLGMRERLARVGGTLEIESSPGSGTSVFARIPLTRSDSASSPVCRDLDP